MNVWEERRVPSHFWSNTENQKDFLRWLAKKYDVTCLDDWYKVPSRAYPIRLLKLYGNYHSQILAKHFPDHEWLEWKFVRTPHNFWFPIENRRRYMDWLGNELGYTKMEDWYNVTGDDFRNNFGSSLIARYYNNSYQRAVVDLYSEYNWSEWLFENTPDGFWNDISNRTKYMIWLGNKLGYINNQDWYNLSEELLAQNKGLGVYKKLGSISIMVKEYLQRSDVYEWLFQSCPPNYWKTKSNRRLYMDWLGKKLGFTKITDWYKVSGDDFKNNSGFGFLSKCYKGSPSSAVIDNYPEHEWLEWLYLSPRQRFWSNRKNCLRYLEWLGQKLGYINIEDWYKVTVNDFRDNNGGGFLGHHNDSPTEAIIETYKEYGWELSKFTNRPQGYWQSPLERKKFLDGLFKILGFKKLDDWYGSSNDDFQKNGGTGLLRYYSGSHIKAIIENYPEHPWLEWKFIYSYHGFWENQKNRKRYIIWLGKQLGFSKPNDWYKISVKDFETHYGGGLLTAYFRGSPSRAVIESFPEQEWVIWKFQVAPQGFWKKKSNRKQYINWLANQLGITDPKEWYEITKKRLADNYGSGFLDYYNNSFMLAISDCIPDYRWNVEEFSQKRTNQKRVYKIVKEIWADAKWQYRHNDLRFKDSGAKMEMDIWISSINIAIEYQGEQHFFPVKSWGGDIAFKNTQKRDQEKRDICKAKGIKLIEVPYTWDGDKKSLLELIQPSL